MSLASHNGKDTFTINGKTVNKRSGTDDVYDITAGSNSFMSGLNMATHDYRLYGNNDLNNRTTLTIPNFTSTSKVLIIHDNHSGGVTGDIYEIMRQTLLGPGGSATIQLGSASPAVTFTLSESGVLDGSWPLGTTPGMYRTISVCHFYTVVESGSLEERIAALEASSGGGLTNALVCRMTVPVNTQTGRMIIYRLNQHELVWYESGPGLTHTVDMSDGGTWTYGDVKLMASGFPMPTQFDASIHDLYILVDDVWYKVPVSEGWNSYGGGFSGSHPDLSADPADNPELLRIWGDGPVLACVNQAGEFRWYYHGRTLYNQTSGVLNFHLGLEIRLSG